MFLSVLSDNRIYSSQYHVIDGKNMLQMRNTNDLRNKKKLGWHTTLS